MQNFSRYELKIWRKQVIAIRVVASHSEDQLVYLYQKLKVESSRNERTGIDMINCNRWERENYIWQRHKKRRTLLVAGRQIPTAIEMVA